MLDNFYEFLASNPEISGQVSGAIYPAENFEGTYPAITYSLISNNPDYILSGAVPTSTARIQVDILSTEHQDTDNIATSVMAALHGYRGVLGSLFAIVRLDNEIEAPLTYAGGKAGDNVWIYQRTQDYILRYNDLAASFNSDWGTDFG